tara:strand:- start:73 stop:369 length:297 start_codon:yes stop_codon:yes gene_type:complete
VVLTNNQLKSNQMNNLINTLYRAKSGHGHYRISMEMGEKQFSTITTNMHAIDAAFDEYYDDEDNEDSFYESRLEAQEALVTEILRANEDEIEQIEINQ